MAAEKKKPALKINKKILLIAGGVVLVAGLAAGIAATVFHIRGIKEDYELQLATSAGTIAGLQQQIQEVGPLITAYELKYDVKSGSIADIMDFNEVTIPQKASAGYVTNINDVVGQRYKVDLEKGDLVSEHFFYEMEVTPNLRVFDVPVDQMPIHLEVGDYVDVRFQYSMGQDFIAMEHKEVLDVNGNVVTILADAADIHIDASMRVDQRYYASCKVYLTQYLEGGVQGGTRTYYPVRYEQLATMLDDPNIPDDYDFDKYTMVDRAGFEELIVSNIRSANSELDDEIAQLVEVGVANYQASIQSAQAAYNEKTGASTVNSSGSTRGNYDPNAAGNMSVAVMN